MHHLNLCIRHIHRTEYNATDCKLFSSPASFLQIQVSNTSDTPDCHTHNTVFYLKACHSSIVLTYRFRHAENFVLVPDNIQGFRQYNSKTLNTLHKILLRLFSATHLSPHFLLPARNRKPDKAPPETAQKDSMGNFFFS